MATYMVKVMMEMSTGVVAQKYTHRASRYFLPFRLLSSADLHMQQYLSHVVVCTKGVTHGPGKWCVKGTEMQTISITKFEPTNRSST